MGGEFLIKMEVNSITGHREWKMVMEMNCNPHVTEAQQKIYQLLKTFSPVGLHLQEIAGELPRVSHFDLLEAIDRLIDNDIILSRPSSIGNMNVYAIPSDKKTPVANNATGASFTQLEADEDLEDAEYDQLEAETRQGDDLVIF